MILSHWKSKQSPWNNFQQIKERKVHKTMPSKLPLNIASLIKLKSNKPRADKARRRHYPDGTLFPRVRHRPISYCLVESSFLYVIRTGCSDENFVRDECTRVSSWSHTPASLNWLPGYQSLQLSKGFRHCFWSMIRTARVSFFFRVKILSPFYLSFFYCSSEVHIIYNKTEIVQNILRRRRWAAAFPCRPRNVFDRRGSFLLLYNLDVHGAIVIKEGGSHTHTHDTLVLIDHSAAVIFTEIKPSSVGFFSSSFLEVIFLFI